MLCSNNDNNNNSETKQQQKRQFRSDEFCYTEIKTLIIGNTQCWTPWESSCRYFHESRLGSLWLPMSTWLKSFLWVLLFLSLSIFESPSALCEGYQSGLAVDTHCFLLSVTLAASLAPVEYNGCWRTGRSNWLAKYHKEQQKENKRCFLI